MSRQPIQKRREPAFIEPMQCKPVRALPTGENWTFEIKFDGYRCIAVKREREVTLFSRREKVLNRSFPGVVEAITSLDGDFVVDGELVALDPRGKPSFQILQHNILQSLPIYCYAFDLLNKNGDLLVNSPLSGRREMLEKLLAAPKDPLRLSPLLQAPSDQILEAVRKLGLEGIVGKRIDSIYEPGERSGTWIKLRTNMEQEFVIGVTFLEHAGSMHCLQAFMRTRSSSSVAKVKNGFVPRIRDELFPPLKALQTANCPFKNLPEKRASRWGESLTAEKMNQSSSARSPSSNGRTLGTCGIAHSSPCEMTRNGGGGSRTGGRWVDPSFGV